MITPSFGLTATERVLPKLALDFTTASLDARVTFTRTTDATHPATYVDSSGYITAATNNQPRFDYDPVTLACKGLLIEESRSNLFTYSSALDDASWLKTASGTGTAPAVTPNNATAPDGTLTADTIVFNTGAGTTTSDQSILSKAVTVTNATVYTDSFYLNGTAGAKLLMRGVASSGYTQITLTGSWQRVTLAETSSGTSRGIELGLRQGLSGIGTINSSVTVAVWGMQLELGAFATSYIPTTTAALTRNADVAVMTGTNFSDWFNASQGSFEFVGDLLALFNGPTFIKADDGTENERYFLYGNASFSPTIVVTDGGVAQASRSSGTLVANTQFKTVYGYKLDDFGISTNAGSVQTDTAGTLPTVTQLGIGCNAAGTPAAFMNGHVAKVFYWPQKLTSAEIRAFSK